MSTRDTVQMMLLIVTTMGADRWTGGKSTQAATRAYPCWRWICLVFHHLLRRVSGDFVVHEG